MPTNVLSNYSNDNHVLFPQLDLWHAPTDLNYDGGLLLSFILQFPLVVQLSSGVRGMRLYNFPQDTCTVMSPDGSPIMVIIRWDTLWNNGKYRAYFSNASYFVILISAIWCNIYEEQYVNIHCRNEAIESFVQWFNKRSFLRKQNAKFVSQPTTLCT